jgi:hypothetical protein
MKPLERCGGVEAQPQLSCLTVSCLCGCLCLRRHVAAPIACHSPVTCRSSGRRRITQPLSTISSFGLMLNKIRMYSRSRSFRLRGQGYKPQSISSIFRITGE